MFSVCKEHGYLVPLSTITKVPLTSTSRSNLPRGSMHAKHDVESSKNSALTDELLNKEPAAASSSPTSERPPTRKQTWKDFIAGCITGCGVAGV